MCVCVSGQGQNRNERKEQKRNQTVKISTFGYINEMEQNVKNICIMCDITDIYDTIQYQLNDTSDVFVCV